ncbi:MAG TPA: Rv3654c family TadE-like protein [Nocardioidaceae bacterium]
MPANRESTDGGYATVWAVGWMACSLTVALCVLLATVAVAAQHHLDGSADLVALAAAGAAQHGVDPCASARKAARANGVALIGCLVDRDDVTVHVSDVVRFPLGLDTRIEGWARAGPA